MSSTLESRPTEADDAADRKDRKLRREWTLYFAEAAALPILAVALIVFFAMLPAASGFLSAGNVQATLGNQAVLVGLAVAALIPLVAGRYDFSVGATMGMSSVFAASAMADGTSVLNATLLCGALGLIAGLFNGIFVTKFRGDSVIVTLGTATLISGVVIAKTNGVNILSGIPQNLTDLGAKTILGVPEALIITLLVALAVYYMLRHMPFGRRLEAVGVNEGSARLVGLGVDRLVIASFAASGVLSGLVGILQVAVSGVGNPLVGPAYTLPAIAAAFLSITAITPGRYNVGGALAAIFFLAVLDSGLNLAGAATHISDFANGAALLVGMAIAGAVKARRLRGGYF